MSERLFTSELNPSEKLILAYILTGHYRFKYIALETFSKKLYMSQPSISKTLKQLEQKELIKWVRVENNKYKIIVVCQKAFNKYGFLDKGEKINENKTITRDPVILTLGEIEANKSLITFDKKEIKKNYERREGVKPSWYDDFKNEVKAPVQMNEDQEKEMKDLVKTLF